MAKSKKPDWQGEIWYQYVNGGRRGPLGGRVKVMNVVLASKIESKKEVNVSDWKQHRWKSERRRCSCTSTKGNYSSNIGYSPTYIPAERDIPP